jgi:PTH1 family peptidyl-tRNA hydrolase
MWLVVGLGNPGAGYANHRHNAGFMAVDALARAHQASAFSKKFHSEVADASIADTKCLLLKPQTFMNLSGKAVLAAAQFYKIAPEKILVLHDELDLPPAKLRIKQGGGHGGHNGLRDIDAMIGQNYWRVRLGIGHPGNKDMVHSYVLSPFSSAERPMMEDFLTALAAHMPLFWQKSPAALMSKLARENA